MKTVRLRPTFSIEVNGDPDRLLHQIRSEVGCHTKEFVGQFRSRQGVISIVESKRHFWSPWLNLDIRQTETGVSVFGQFNPHPAVWTAIAFSYLTLGILLFFSLMVGVSQQLAGQSAWGYYMGPICLLMGFVLWMISQVGQRLAESEMAAMQSVVESALRQYNQDSHGINC